MAIINCNLGQNSSYYKVYIEYSYTQNISENTSTITAALKLQQLTDSYDFDTVSAVKVGFTMAGEEFSKSQRININDKGNTGYTITLASGTKTVDHDSSGKKTIIFSCNNTSSLLNSGGYGPGSITLSSTSVVLKQIPRNSEINKVTNTSGTTISSLNVDNGLRVYYTPTASTYYHRLAFYVGSTKKKTVNLGKASSTSQKYYTLSSVPASWLPSSTSGTLKCYLYTYSDSTYETKIGSTDSESITINVPNTNTYKPTISLADTYTYNNDLNVCLKGVSKATFKITGTAGSGASISSYSLSGNGVSSTSASTTITFNQYSESEGLTYTAKVTDSRGRTATASKKIIVYNYAKPVISSGSVSRNASTQTRVDGKVDASVSSVGGKNSISTIYWYYRLFGASDWTKVRSSSIDNNTITTSPTTLEFNIYKTYQFRFKVTDAARKYTYSKIYTVSTSVVPINIAPNNNGVAIGGLSSVESSTETGKFECNWDMYMNKTFRFPQAWNDANNYPRITCLWRDGSSHEMITRSSDGLTMGIGWTGNGEGGNTYSTQLSLRPPLVTASDTITAPRGRFTATDDASGTKQNDVALRVGDNTGNHIDFDGNEIQAKTNATTTGTLYLNNDGGDVRCGNSLISGSNLYTNGKTEYYDGKQGISVSSNGRIYMTGDLTNTSVTTPGIMFAHNKSTSATSSILETTSGEITINGLSIKKSYLTSEATYNRTYDKSGNVYITSTGILGRGTSSSRRYKTNIEEIHNEELNPYKILNIPVCQYKYNEDNIPIDKKPDDLYIGLIAEDVAKEYPVAAEYNEDGQVEMWNIKVIVPAMLKIIQDQQKKIESLESEMKTLKIEVDNMKK